MSSRLTFLIASAGASLIALGGTLIGASAPGAPAAFVPPSLGVCPAELSHVVARAYDVGARVRVLLFWTGRHEEGSARIAWSAGQDGTHRTELLIGTDPARAFRGLNRWGYIAETVCASGAEIVGLMTASDEASIEEAQANLGSEGAGGSVYRVIRACIANNTATADLLRLTTGETFTYRDAAALFDRLPVTGALKRVAVPTDVDAGLLAATSRLIALDLAEIARPLSRGLSNARRRYVYAATTYELALTSSRLWRELTIGTVRYSNPLEAGFAIVNLTTRETTEFTLTVGTSGDLAGVPLRIAYRTRWWLELEVTLLGRPDA